MNDLANLANAFLEHTMSRRVRHHQRTEIVAVLLRLCAKIRDVDVAPGFAGDGNDTEPSHHRARRVGPVRGERNQTNVTLPLTALPVIFSNDQQARKLAL